MINYTATQDFYMNALYVFDKNGDFPLIKQGEVIGAFESVDVLLVKNRQIPIALPSEVLAFLNNTETVADPELALGGGGSIGVTDHGALTGLADDDHAQYHNDTRGDVRYYTQVQVDSALTAKADAAGLAAVATSGSYTDLADQPTTISGAQATKLAGIADGADVTPAVATKVVLPVEFGGSITVETDLYAADRGVSLHWPHEAATLTKVRWRSGDAVDTGAMTLNVTNAGSAVLTSALAMPGTTETIAEAVVDQNASIAKDAAITIQTAGGNGDGTKGELLIEAELGSGGVEDTLGDVTAIRDTQGTGLDFDSLVSATAPTYSATDGPNSTPAITFDQTPMTFTPSDAGRVTSDAQTIYSCTIVDRNVIVTKFGASTFDIISQSGGRRAVAMQSRHHYSGVVDQSNLSLGTSPATSWTPSLWCLRATTIKRLTSTTVTVTTYDGFRGKLVDPFWAGNTVGTDWPNFTNPPTWYIGGMPVLSYQLAGRIAHIAICNTDHSEAQVIDNLAALSSHFGDVPSVYTP